MGKYDALVSSIVNNPEKHIVNREEKMRKTLDVMCKNLEVRHTKVDSGQVQLKDEAELRGYGLGNGRNTGD